MGSTGLEEGRGIPVFACELISEIKDEIQPLLELHYKEIAHYPDIKLNPDYLRYQKLEDSGMFKVFTARSDGKLIGYNAFFLNHNLHYMDSYQAIQDILFVDPTRRGFGRNFIKWCDLQLKEMGVQLVLQHLKVKHNFGVILERQGYELIDLIYGKRLDEVK